MMFNSAKHITKIISYLCAGLVLLAGGVHAQTEPGAERVQTEQGAVPAAGQTQPTTPEEAPAPSGRASSSYQLGANYQTPPASEPKGAPDKVSRARQQERNLRRMMASFGVTEQDLQNAIIVYVQEEVQRRQPLREQGRRLYKALKDETIAAAEMTGLLMDFRAVVDADKARRTAAEAALNDQTGYATNPRLEAMLLLFGVIGDGPTIMTITVPPSTPAPAAPKAPPETHELQPDVDKPDVDNGVVRPVQNDTGQPALGFSEAQRLALLEQFDFNHDGELDAAERNEAREFLARAYLAQGLWPPALKQKPTPGSNVANEAPAVNNGATGDGNTASRSTPDNMPAPRIPGPLPVIPAGVVTPPGPPAN